MSPEEIWSQTLEKLTKTINHETIIILRSFELYRSGDNWLVNTPNKFAREQIKSSHWKKVEQAMLEVLGNQDPISLNFLSAQQPDMFSQSPALPPTTQSALPQEPPTETPFETNLNPDYQFNNFMSGPSNDNALAAAQAVARGFNAMMNPLLIYGGTGLGKSHLMHAIGNAMVEERGLKRVRFISAEEFLNQMVNSIRTKTTPEFMASFRKLDALLIDDVQFLGGKDRSQVEFFHTFNTLYDQKRQIIMTCDRYPNEIEGLEDRLRSRFGQGLAVTVAPPEFETRVAILKAKAAKTNFTLPTDVAFFIAENVASNVRELEGALRKVYSECQFKHRGIAPTVALAREVLSDQIHSQSKRVNVQNIQKVCAQFYQVTLQELLAKQRGKAHLALARQVAMCLTKELTHLSYPQIGLEFGGRDHSTVMHACKTVQKRIANDRSFSDEYVTLKMSITG